MISLRTTKGDDPNFVALVNRIVGHIVQENRPRNVFLTRINGWFDHKWHGFSGKLLGAVDVRNGRLTIPPFVPSRVLSQEVYFFDDSSGCYHKADAPALHLKQPSRENLNRFIDRVSSSGLFVWFSGDTQSAMGSLMVYSSEAESQSSWYASFRAARDWQIYKAQGISKSELLLLVEGEGHEKGA